MIEISKLCQKNIRRFCLLHMQKFVSNVLTFLFKCKFTISNDFFILLIGIFPLFCMKKPHSFWTNLVIPSIVVGVNDPIKFQMYGQRP